jgi:cytochrome c biogenesis protein CcdA
LIGLAVSIGLADSMNPSTIAPGLYLAMGERPRGGLIRFTLGVLAVNFVGGAAIALGPGEAVLALVPKPGATARYIAETVAGGVMLGAAVVIWRRRRSLARRELPSPSPQGKSSLLLGVTIGAVELPTAFPYFAVIAAIVGSGFNPIRQLILLALYNLAFVLPLILMIATLMIAPDRAAQILARARDWLQRHWPTLLAGLALIAGAARLRPDRCPPVLGRVAFTGQT